MKKEKLEKTDQRKAMDRLKKKLNKKIRFKLNREQIIKYEVYQKSHDLRKGQGRGPEMSHR